MATRTVIKGLTFDEDIDSRRWVLGANPRYEIRITATGSDDEENVKKAAISFFPPSAKGMTLDTIELTPKQVDTITRTGRWSVVATYVEAPQMEQSFSTVGGTFRMMQSLRTRTIAVPSGTTKIPNYKGAINVDDKKVDGVDIRVRTYEFTETYEFFSALVTPQYKAQLFAMSGTVNDAGFRGFAAGEVFFAGAQAQGQAAGKSRIVFTFLASPNLANIKIGDITVPNKDGWEYLWVRYAEKVDTTNGILVRVPQAAFVEQVYETADFTRIGIGTELTPIVQSGPR